MTTELTVGIDLGTVNSSVAVCLDDGKASIVETSDGKITPSFVFYDPTTTRTVIGSAGISMKKNKECGIYDAKRFIGRKFMDAKVQEIHKNYQFKITEDPEENATFEFTHNRQKVKKTPEDVGAEILTYFNACLESTFFEKKNIKAVITIPAYFNNEQREATKRAAEKVNFTVLALMKEPTAAALHFFNQNPEAHGMTLIFDLGGGTFDVSVVEKSGEDSIDVKCYDGDNFLGGRNFDEAIVKHLIEEQKKETQTTFNEQQEQRLHQPATMLKESLSKKTSAFTVIQNFPEDGEDLFVTLKRDKFEELNKKLFDKCLEIVQRCLDQNNINKSEIKNVVLVGGSTRIPKIQKMVQEFFNEDAFHYSIDCDTSVALGAASYAYTLANKNNCTIIPRSTFNLFKINDVTTMDIGTGLMFKLSQLIIKRNTRLPVKETIKQVTGVNHQTNCTSKWFEGNWKCVEKNHFLGETRLRNLPAKQAGQVTIEHVVEVDVNNILKITSRVPDTGETTDLQLNLENDDGLGRIDDIEWNVRDDETFEKLAIIKTIFYHYYARYSILQGIAQREQNEMNMILDNIEDEAGLLAEINKFVSMNTVKYSESIDLIKKLVECVKEPIEILREMSRKVQHHVRS